MSMCGFSVCKYLFEHGITGTIVGSVTDDERFFWQRWRFARIFMLNPLNQSKSTYRLGVLYRFHNPGGGISDFLHNFQ